MGRKNNGKRKAPAGGSIGGGNPKAGKRSGAGKRGVRSGRGRPDTVVTGDVEHAVDDIYEADDVAVDEELHRDRYDDLDDEFDLPAGFEDEEIDEDEAFNSEDERQYGYLFEENGGGKYSDYDSEEEELAEEADGHANDKGEKEEEGLAYDALVSDEELESELEQGDHDDDDDDEAAWPEEDGEEGRGGRDEAGEFSDDGDDGVGPAGGSGHLDGGDDHGGSDDGGFEGEDGWRNPRRVEMIRELYPENIYAVGSGT
jgi:hypothetical protein